MDLGSYKQRKKVQEFQASVARTGQQNAYIRDMYTHLLRMSWLKLLGFFIFLFFSMNVFFAMGYVLTGDTIQNARAGSFIDAFFFSVQTSTTIGYGGMSPKGFLGNALVSIESMVSLLGFAMVTGLIFGKFSMPTARIVFSQHAVIMKQNGIPCLSFRVANERGNNILEAAIRVTVLLEEYTEEGERLRRMHELQLIRANTPIFFLSWVLFHEIDESSPLYGKSLEQLEEEDARFFISFTGLDETLSQTIHANFFYLLEDLLWNYRLKDIMTVQPDKQIHINLNLFHEVEPIEAEQARLGEKAI